MPALAIILPLLSGLLYAVGAAVLKRSTSAGVGPWRTTFVSNLTLALMIGSLWLWERTPISLEILGWASLGTLAFFLGQVFTFLAIARGDVSLATPVMGVKVIFVALIAVSLGIDPLSPALLFGAVLATLAVVALGLPAAGMNQLRRRSIWPTIGFGALSAFFFAVADILTAYGGNRFGLLVFVPLAFGMLPIPSLMLIPFFRQPLSKLPAGTFRWLGLGCGIIAIQAGLMAWSLSAFYQPTATNIFYSGRGLWSILLIWLVGTWFTNREAVGNRRLMIQRAVGAILLTAAIVVTLSGG